jgi:hypothetical protein
MELDTSFVWSWGDNEPKLIVSTVFSFYQYTVWLQIGRQGFDVLQKQNDFSSSLCVQTSFYAHPTPTQPPVQRVPGSIPGSKMEPGRDADHG